MARTKGAKNKPKIVMPSKEVPRVHVIEPVVTRNDTIVIIKQEDGNWKGEMQINGRLKTTRQVSPESVLQYLLYHDGDTYQ